MSTSSKIGKILRLPDGPGEGINVSGGTTVLLGAFSENLFSENFRVEHNPVTLRIFNAVDDDEIAVHQVVYVDECNVLSQPIVINGTKLLLSKNNTQVELALGGLYRLHVVHPESLGLVTVVAIDNFVPSGVIRHGK
jgi:hypothetical protein